MPDKPLHELDLRIPGLAEERERWRALLADPDRVEAEGNEIGSAWLAQLVQHFRLRDDVPEHRASVRNAVRGLLYPLYPHPLTTYAFDGNAGLVRPGLAVELYLYADRSSSPIKLRWDPRRVLVAA